MRAPPPRLSRQARPKSGIVATLPREGGTARSQTTDVRAAMLTRADIIAAHEPNFARFLRHALAATTDEDLALYAPETLETLWRQSYGRLGKRDPSRHALNLDADGPGHCTVIDIFCPNMP